jgi:hypothetical protein
MSRSFRFFRVLASDETYEAARLALDAEWGLPDDKGTQTCISPAAASMRDTQGRIVLGLDAEFCQFPAAALMLPQLLASGAVAEIDEATYLASLPPAP